MGPVMIRGGLRFTFVVLLALAGLPWVGLAHAAATGGDERDGGPPGQVRTIPYFADAFVAGKVRYPYTMVGTDPRARAETTKVRNVIVPLRFVFADGSVAEPGGTVDAVRASPLYQAAPFDAGVTQYGDAMRRAMFWADVAGRDYHVLLARPRVLPVQTLVVPAGEGVYLHAGDPAGPPALGLHVAVAEGVVSYAWFHGGAGPGAFERLLGRLDLDPQEVAIAVSRNVALSDGGTLPYGAPVLGFHAAYPTTEDGVIRQVQTAIWADYADPYPVVEFPGLTANATVLSHEIVEWLHDPFLSNVVPGWHSPLPLSSLFYGCSQLLETGDAVSEVAFQVGGYQLSDAAFFSWFAREVPSRGIGGRYSYLGALTALSQPCP